MSKATDALDKTITYGYVTTDRLRKPGEVVLKQSQETRNELKQLKSDEIANVRDDVATFLPFMSKELQAAYLRYRRRKHGK